MKQKQNQDLKIIKPQFQSKNDLMYKIIRSGTNLLQLEQYIHQSMPNSRLTRIKLTIYQFVPSPYCECCNLGCNTSVDGVVWLDCGAVVLRLR